MRITTDRLDLREYTPGDLPALFAYQADPRTREFYGPDEGRADQLPGLLQTFLDWAAEAPRRNWQLAITLCDDPASVVGSCGLRSAGCQPGCADLGLDLTPDLWGGRYGTEAAIAMLDFGLGSLRLERIRAQTVSGNARVAALVRKLGFRLQGVHPGPRWMSERGWAYANWELHARDRRRRSDGTLWMGGGRECHAGTPEPQRPRCGGGSPPPDR